MTKKVVTSIVAGILFLGLLIVLGVVGWGLNKGFDFTDAGFHVMLLKFPEESPPFWQYQWFVHHLFGWLNLEILGFKVIRYVLTIISSWVLTWGFWHWTQQNTLFRSFSFNKIAVFCFITIGSFISYSLQPTTLSYNTFVLICMEVIMGLVLYGMTKVPMRGEGKTEMTGSRYAVFIGTGIMIGLMFFAKFTTSVLFAVVLIGVYTLFRLNRGSLELGKLIVEMGCVALGGFLVLGYFHLFIQPFPGWVEQIFAYQKVYPDHDIMEVMHKYQRSTMTALKRSIVRFWEIPLFLGLIFGIYTWYVESNTKENIEKAGRWLMASFGFMMFYILANAKVAQWYYSGMVYNQKANNIYILILTCILFILSIYVSKDRLKALWSSSNIREAVLIGLTFLLLPVVASFGNNNPLPLQCTGYLFSWFVAFLILFSVLERVTQKQYVPALFAFLLSIFGIAQTINGYVYNPQRVNGTLWQQTETLEGFGQTAPMRVDIKTKYFVEEIRELLETKTLFESGDPMIALSKMPGLVYLLDGLSPTNSWTHSDYHALNCYHVSHTDLDNLDKTILIMEENTELVDSVQTCFNENGILYPSNYINIGDIRSFENQADKVSIFAPLPMLKEGAL